MAKFRYKALDKDKNLIEGEIQDLDMDSAIKTLRTRGLTLKEMEVLELDGYRENEKRNSNTISLFLFIVFCALFLTGIYYLLT